MIQIICGSKRWMALIWLAGGVLVVNSGCVTPSSSSKLDKAIPLGKKNADPPSSGARKIIVDGKAISSGQSDEEVARRQKFERHFDSLIQEQRLDAARLWAERHPDLTLEVLYHAAGEESLKPNLMTLAQIRDNHCPPRDANVGWTAFFSQSNQSQRLASYRQARAKLLQQIQLGHWSQSDADKLIKAASDVQHPAVSMDAYRLVGIAQIVAGEGLAAVDSLDQAVRLAKSFDDHQAALMLLMLSDAARRADHHESSRVAWTEAVSMAAQLLTRPNPVADPTLWDQVLELQPSGVVWPVSVTDLLARSERLPPGLQSVQPIARQPLIPSAQRDESLTILASIGYMRLQRGEPQESLIAFKQAEGRATKGSDTSEWLRLGQARALAALQQTPSAIAILMPQASGELRSPMTLAATAELGSIKLQQGLTPQGIALLERALQSEIQWPGHSQAEANLGLAYLMVGDEMRGLQRLKSARSLFEAEGNHEAKAQSIWNEARYWEQKGNRERHVSLDNEYRETKL